MKKTLIVNRELCKDILTVEKCIPAMKKALAAVSENQTKMLQRAMILHDNGNAFANMPASIVSEGITGTKTIIFPGPVTTKQKTQQGIIPLFSIETGALLAIIDAELITVIRTAATSAAATDFLANKDASTVAILGSGKQGKAHAEAMIAVRDIKTVYMWDIYMSAAEEACRQLTEKYPNVEFVPCFAAKQTVENADIICTTTPGKTETPVLLGQWVKKGTHINAVGACSAKGRELDAQAIKQSVIFTDWNDAVNRDGGDILLAVEKGELDKMPDMFEVGSVINGTHPGRPDQDRITIFESVGISVEDIAAANVIYQYAKDNNLGIYVEI